MNLLVIFILVSCISLRNTDRDRNKISAQPALILAAYNLERSIFWLFFFFWLNFNLRSKSCSLLNIPMHCCVLTGDAVWPLILVIQSPLCGRSLWGSPEDKRNTGYSFLLGLSLGLGKFKSDSRLLQMGKKEKKTIPQKRKLHMIP